jgi:hypothetical protein
MIHKFYKHRKRRLKGRLFGPTCPIRRMIVHAKRWLPICVLLGFFVAVAANWFVGHAQDIMQNTVHIAELKADMHDMARDVQDLKDLPIQMSALRERMVRVEGGLAQAQKQLDSIDLKGDWVIGLVGGVLLTQIIRGIKFSSRDTESSDHLPLIKP